MGLIDWARNLFGFGKLNKETTPAGTIEKEFGVQPAASRKMENNINLCYVVFNLLKSVPACLALRRNGFAVCVFIYTMSCFLLFVEVVRQMCAKK